MKFNGFNQVQEDSFHSVNASEGGDLACCLAVDLISNLEKQFGNTAGFQGMLEMMMSLLVQLMTCEFIWSAERLFHSVSSWSHRLKVFYSGATSFSDGLPLTKPTHS